MSLSIPGAPNAGLFKPGYQNHDSEDGAVIRNIDACRTIAQTVQTSLGPYGRNKIVINHLQKMILTNDAATILRELEVVHPAAKLLVMASQQQEAEMGDATNLVIVLAGELLKKAEDLIRMGLKTSEIAKGYERAQGFALKALEELEVERVEDIRSQAELAKALRTVIAAKQSGNEDFLADKVAEAVLAVMPKNPYNFNVDNVRVVKIMGGGLEQSKVVKGMVFGREPDGSIKKASNAKVGVYSCPIDISQTETKGTVLLKNSKELLDFSKGEESQMEAAIKEIHDSGIRVIVAGATVGELAMHYLSQYAIKKYAEAFEVIPRTLAESAGLDATEVLARLYTAHNSYQQQQNSKKTDSSSEDESPIAIGVDIENEDGTGTLDAEEEGILDLMVSKSWAIKLATESVRTILSVDQIIVARQAGGPKPPGPNPNWDDD